MKLGRMHLIRVATRSAGRSVAHWQTLVLPLFVLSACSGTSAEERLCRANVSSGLLNPETAEFYEFQRVDRPAFEEFLTEAALKGRGVVGRDRIRYADAIPQFRRVAEETATSMERNGATFRRFRVKADDRLGQTVTSIYFCAVSASQCSCFNDESIASELRG